MMYKLASKILILGLLSFTCCQAAWPFFNFHNVENKGSLKSKSETDLRLAAFEKAVVQKAVQKAREEARAEKSKVEERFAVVEKKLLKREDALEEARAERAKVEERFAVVEKKLLKVTAVNRNFRIFAERFDESQHRERRTAKVAETSKLIGATLVKVAEITMPVCNSWYDVSKIAREIHRNGLSDLELCDLTESEHNVALKHPYLFQVPIFFTVALVRTYPFRTCFTVAGGVFVKHLYKRSMPYISKGMGMFKASLSDSKVSALLSACMSQHLGWFACCSKEADKARRRCCDFACEKVTDTRNWLGQAFKNFFKKGLFKK